ncbi:MAG: integrase [Akkermansiaceae bacterium]|jgi:integrase
MGRVGQLEITKDKQSGKWILNVSAKLSQSGKKRRLKFGTKKEAEAHRTNLALVLKSSNLRKYDEGLLATANYYSEAFILHGFKGLDDACAEWLKQLEKRHQSQHLLELITAYETNRGADWSDGYKVTFNWAKNQLKAFHEKPISGLDAQHWEAWLPGWRKRGKYSAKSFNHLRTFLVSIYSMPAAAAFFPSHPIRPIPSAKIKKKEVKIASNDETRNLLNRAMEEDPDLVPWFAIAFFAGLRPQSELGKLDWSDINFEEKWIRVGFGNKTDTKRFVDLSETLVEWLKPFKRSKGPVQQPNHRKRKDQLVEGVLSWARDITRHTYGSNLEAHARAGEKDAKSHVLANMGHSVLQTFEQHYRNARTAKQAQEYWAISPKA